MTVDQDLELRHELAALLPSTIDVSGGTRALYATDSSNYRHAPIGVVVPRHTDEVVAALAACRDLGVAVVLRGAGTSLAGQACNEAVVIDTSRHLNRILELDPDARRARVEPGVVLDDLRRAAERHGLTFGPDPATHAWCTLGGMIGNNSCGSHALFAGKTVDNVDALDVLTYRGARLALGAADARTPAITGAGGDGARIEGALRALADAHADLVRARFPQLARRVSGYNLDALLPENGFHVARSLVGSESTCAVTLGATLRLVDSPPERRLVVLGFADVFAAADAVPEVLGEGVIALEGFDATLVRHMRAAHLHLDKIPLLPSGEGWLLAEVGAATAAEADALAEALARNHGPRAETAIFSDRARQADIWAIRESGLGATAHPPGGRRNYEGWEDAAVPPERLGEYLRGIDALWKRYGYAGAWYGHFGHGCVHTRNDFDFTTAAGVARFRAYVEEAADLCVRLGGSLSGEHGDGQARGELLEKMFGAEVVAAFGAFKAIWDPDDKMNPGRLVRARPLDADLHYGPSYRKVSLGPTRFALRGDGGSLQTAAERCVGVGRCRSASGVMCPSFQATGEERHATRGRAKLLVEMFQGELTPASWRNQEVFDALDLCLSCKGCANECPTRVDMATYKAEFLSHYYAGRLRPLASYVLGLLPWLARPASYAPRLANAFLGEHGLGRAIRRLLGLATGRPAPAFAPRPFRRSATARRLTARGAAAISRAATGSAATGSAAISPATTGSATTGVMLDAAVSGAANTTTGTVVLFVDTFSDLYLPARAAAAVELLERLGERVVLPAGRPCCGRPLYDQGMLATARRTLAHSLDVLAPHLAAGLPIVVLEPSCLATFRDELVGLLPDDPRARQLATSATSLAGFLLERHPAPPADAPAHGTGASVAVHVHCHQRATVGDAAERALLTGWGFAPEVLDTGCCGLAGSFGFRAEHEELSRTIAGQRFVPAVAACADRPLVADGFSCVIQATQLAGRTPAHLADLLLARLGDGPGASGRAAAGAV